MRLPWPIRRRRGRHTPSLQTLRRAYDAAPDPPPVDESWLRTLMRRVESLPPPRAEARPNRPTQRWETLFPSPLLYRAAGMSGVLALLSLLATIWGVQAVTGDLPGLVLLDPGWPLLTALFLP